MTSTSKERGYVALEFVVAMGLLVLPTALILLQIPTYLERHNRLESIASVVAQRCADEAHTSSQAQHLARESAESEMAVSSVMNHVTLHNVSCSFERIPLQPGDEVVANISTSMPAALVPGVNYGPSWTMAASHVSIVPKYREFND